jgi:hypothetical protein
VVGPAIGVHLLFNSPHWCSAPFIGCMVESYLFAACGWLLGLGASAISLWSKEDRSMAGWVIGTWNALGTLLCTGALMLVAAH